MGSILVDLNLTLGKLNILENKSSLLGVDKRRRSTTQSYNK